LAIVGVGHELRGDDAAGIAIVQALQSSVNAQSLIINAGTVPENVTGALRGFAPDLVLIIDAVQMNEMPGTIRLLDIRDTENCSVTTHTLSFHMFAFYLETELNCMVKLLGIQAGQDLLGAEFSRPVYQSICTIRRVLHNLSENDHASCIS
jgi:hydrogenase 3 maturation protease